MTVDPTDGRTDNTTHGRSDGTVCTTDGHRRTVPDGTVGTVPVSTRTDGSSLYGSGRMYTTDGRYGYDGRTDDGWTDN